MGVINVINIVQMPHKHYWKLIKKVYVPYYERIFKKLK